MHVQYAAPNAQLVNTDIVLDAAQVNQLRIRLKAPCGRWAGLYWGRPPNDTAGGYPFSDERVTVFPIRSDGAFHTYAVSLEHAVADWRGQWTALRLDPATLHPEEGDMTGEMVVIDAMALGFVPSTDQPPDPWAAIDAPGWDWGGSGVSRPDWTVVHAWEFEDDAGGWRVTEGQGNAEAVGGVLRLAYGTGTMRLLNTDFVLDTEQVNRLRIRLKSRQGDWASFYWGKRPGDTSDAYPFSDQRGIEFAIRNDGAFHTYEIPLDRLGKDWTGRWTALRLDGPFSRAGEGGLTGKVVEIDSIVLGFAENGGKL